jgi:hypothetical protein
MKKVVDGRYEVLPCCVRLLQPFVERGVRIIQLCEERRLRVIYPCEERRLCVIHPCDEVVEPFVHVEVEVGDVLIGGEVVGTKLSVGVGELFGHGGAPCVEVIPRHGHKAKSILWKVGLLENYN